MSVDNKELAKILADNPNTKVVVLAETMYDEYNFWCEYPESVRLDKMFYLESYDEGAFLFESQCDDIIEDMAETYVYDAFEELTEHEDRVNKAKEIIDSLEKEDVIVIKCSPM